MNTPYFSYAKYTITMIFPEKLLGNIFPGNNNWQLKKIFIVNANLVITFSVNWSVVQKC